MCAWPKCTCLRMRAREHVCVFKGGSSDTATNTTTTARVHACDVPGSAAYRARGCPTWAGSAQPLDRFLCGWCAISLSVVCHGMKCKRFFFRVLFRECRKYRNFSSQNFHHPISNTSHASATRENEHNTSFSLLHFQYTKSKQQVEHFLFTVSER